MISAFGVEHGDEVSKGYKCACKKPTCKDCKVDKAFSALGGAIGGGVKRMSKPLGQAANSSKAGFTAPALKGAGKGFKRAGKFMQNNATATGAGAVGLGGAGAVGAGVALGNNKRRY